jgi:hypothetical protein
MDCPLCGAACVGIDGEVELCPECLLVLCDLRILHPKPPVVRLRQTEPPDTRTLH